MGGGKARAFMLHIMAVDLWIAGAESCKSPWTGRLPTGFYTTLLLGHLSTSSTAATANSKSIMIRYDFAIAISHITFFVVGLDYCHRYLLLRSYTYII